MPWRVADIGNGNTSRCIFLDEEEKGSWKTHQAWGRGDCACLLVHPQKSEAGFLLVLEMPKQGRRTGSHDTWPLSLGVTEGEA